MNEPTLKLISIHSYKGGVGKSTIATLLGLALARTRRVCLVDFDLVAPGLHHLLAVEERQPAILDFLVMDPEKPQEVATAGQVCHEIMPGLPGWAGEKMWIIPGRPDHVRAEGVQGYLLGDLQAGLVQARLKVLLQEVQRAREIDVFVLDTPPSLFGGSTVVRSLVEEQHGALVGVSTPTWQDLDGSLDMLYHIEEAKLKRRRYVLEETGEEPEGEPLAAKAFILNRWVWDPGEPQETIRRALLIAKKDRAQAELVSGQLQSYKVDLIQESDALARMSRIPFKDEQRPAVSEVLAERICRLAETLRQSMEGGAPA